MKKFEVGQRVMWSHNLPSIYGAGSVVKASAAKALDPKGMLCTVVALENEKGTLVKVNPDDAKTHSDTNVVLEDDNVVLTCDELIAVSEEE